MKSRLAHDRPLRVIAIAHLGWLGTLCLLGAWWGRLVLRQAHRIAELEEKVGLASGVTQGNWHRTQRMLYWESATFFGLLLACTAFLFWLYWRDSKRTKSLHAFFASVTHELRTPLASIRLQAESIAENIPSGSQAHLVQRLLEDSIRLEAQVEKTLELARVEGGGPVYTQPLQIKPWLDRFLKSWTDDYRHRVEIQSFVEDVLIEADPAAVQIILKNILENSVKHSKKDKVSIVISSFSENGGVSLSLKDNGASFLGEAQSLGQIFKKGAQSNGTGVGLYLVKTLMKKMGGWANYQIESGFKVNLWFPEGKTHA